ncbi:hypothetical protein BRARA_G02884 [Brassica rapa]|uniref:Methyltransferase type 11 domain-containing protein n=1 Tax=Brassica campestris TaxID=3711 RepID=A0A397YQE4_BRACM|nr:hypothetical protein BRARA_G02884 [Brassica rapa]
MAILNLTPSSMFPVTIDSARRTRVRGSVIKMQKSLITTDPPASSGFSLYASVDAVVGSLVMCSVSDIPQTLKEIKRILKPGGLYLFVEHVAAEDGTFLRMVQNVLDPLQQVVADGCHLTRNTEDYLLEAGFKGGVDINKVSLSAFYHLSPHLYGVAYN